MTILIILAIKMPVSNAEVFSYNYLVFIIIVNIYMLAVILKIVWHFNLYFFAKS